MKVLVLGATGPTGRHLVDRLLGSGHEVTALVRRPDAVVDRPSGLRVLGGDATRPGDVLGAASGQAAIMSTLGMGSSVRATGMFTRASTAVVAAAQEVGVSRLVWLSSFGVGHTRAWSSTPQKIIYGTLLRSLYADKTTADAGIRASELDWTVVLPTRLTDAAAAGRYRSGDRLPMRGNPTIARADVAGFMHDALQDETWLRRDVVISD